MSGLRTRLHQVRLRLAQQLSAQFQTLPLNFTGNPSPNTFLYIIDTFLNFWKSYHCKAGFLKNFFKEKKQRTKQEAQSNMSFVIHIYTCVHTCTQKKKSYKYSTTFLIVIMLEYENLGWFFSLRLFIFSPFSVLSMY